MVRLCGIIRHIISKKYRLESASKQLNDTIVCVCMYDETFKTIVALT